jgi:hypothetical protein
VTGRVYPRSSRWTRRTSTTGRRRCGCRSPLAAASPVLETEGLATR